MPWAAAFVLGAIVSPTDPLAAATIMRRLGAPRRQLSSIEGEGLFNDATALVALRQDRRRRLRGPEPAYQLTLRRLLRAQREALLRMHHDGQLSSQAMNRILPELDRVAAGDLGRAARHRSAKPDRDGWQGRSRPSVSWCRSPPPTGAGRP